MSSHPTIDAEAPTAALDEGGTPTAEGRRDPQVVDETRIGRFEVTGLLGQGGMGTVLAARDPGLDRAVAIKLLREGGGREGVLRLGREAQAMAKLSHPNVVTVYEIGEHAGSIYIAMELVDGRTLRAWRGTVERTWREVIAKYLDAGRGLAAAHAAGLVHRDFKPDNVLIGADGRARVTDFGLVAAEHRAVDSSEAVGVSLDSGLTVEGALMGTPSYMAPEQWAGEPVDARTDQFAFCVALWEALYRERPFHGDTTPQLREAILRGEPRPPPRGTDAPGWLAPVLARGLARAPSARWPSMDALLERLANGSRRRRVRILAAIALGVVAAAGVTIAVVTLRGGSAPSCASIANRIDQVSRDGLDPPIASLVDDYAARWSGARLATCEAGRRGTDTPDVTRLRERCLDKALGDLERTVGQIPALTEPRVAWTMVDRLPEIARCADVVALQAVTPRPTDGGRARKLAEIEAVLAEAETDDILEQHAEALKLARGVLADAEALDHQPTLAAVHYQIGSALYQLGDSAEAESSLRAALRAADAGRDDHLRLEAYLILIDVVGAVQGRFDEAKGLVEDARGALVRIAAPKAYEARLLAYEANLTASAGDDAGAVKLFEQAAPMFEDAYGAESRPTAELEYSLGGHLLAIGDIARAEPMLDHAREVLVRHLGEEAPTIAKIDNARAHARYVRGDVAGAIALQEASLAVRERVDGSDSTTLGNALYTLGAMYKVADRFDDAERTLRRALDIIERKYGKEHPRALMAINELTETLLVADREAEARELAEHGVELSDRLDLGIDVEAKARYLLASSLWDVDRARSIALATRARDDYRAAGDEGNAKTIDAWLAAP